MPFDGFLFASRVMVAKEAHTSSSVKDLIVAAAGVEDSPWEGTYTKPTGGILTVQSELGEPIHKVATRAVNGNHNDNDNDERPPTPNQHRSSRYQDEFEWDSRRRCVSSPRYIFYM
jgi:enoyl reductase-like protein